MKKILALVSFLILAVACTEPIANTNTASNTNMLQPIKPAAPSEADMTAKEKSAWDAIKKKDYDAFGNMLTSDYVEVTDEGVLDKAGALADVKDFNLTDAATSDWKMAPIDNDAVILTYTLNLKATYKNADVPPGPYRAAAVWVNRDGKWSAFYYQQTPVKSSTAPPPPPSPSASKSEKTAAATPAAKSGETGPDPIANEKFVWEAITGRNYDAFGSYLASDFIELEPDGYFDKASAIKSIQMMDPGGFQTSDWKGVKIDNDAQFVTYLVTSPAASKMPPERHSTVWINRNGKWLALLHMGTPQAKATPKTEMKPDMKKM
jgi:hypothetical protein